MTFEWVIPLLTLTAMEIVLGIDNIVFIAILVGRLPRERQGLARQLGLGLALMTRILLLFALSWMLRLTKPLFSLHVLTELGLPDKWLGRETLEVSGRDLILLGGGLFLIAKSTFEIHHSLEGEEGHEGRSAGRAGFALTLVQIALLDIVFSLDSVITAIGMANQIPVMVAAMVIAVGVMLFFARSVSDFVHRHPTVKMLALSFLILIGVMLVADAMGKEIERGYIYFAMGFSFAVEMLNLRLRGGGRPVELHGSKPVDEDGAEPGAASVPREATASSHPTSSPS